MKRNRYICPDFQVYDIQPSEVMTGSNTETPPGDKGNDADDNYDADAAAYRSSLWK